MKQKNLRALLCLLLGLVLLLTGCGTADTGEAGAEPTGSAQSAETGESAQEALPEGAVAVSTVDELLSAIAPNACIVLQEGK